MTDRDQFRAEIEAVPGGHHFRLSERGNAISVERYLQLLDDDDAFRHWYTSLLVDKGPDGFFWEHPPFTSDSTGDPVEFVVIQSLFLSSLKAERAPFEEHFRANPDQNVIAFENLGGDALLIVPAPVGPDEIYPHFASFLKDGPAEQIDSLWQETARQTRQIISDSPRWLSTAGLGVSWVHLRLDTRPKYYRYGPYKQEMRFDPN